MGFYWAKDIIFLFMVQSQDFEWLPQKMSICLRSPGATTCSPRVTSWVPSQTITLPLKHPLQQVSLKLGVWKALLLSWCTCFFSLFFKVLKALRTKELGLDLEKMSLWGCQLRTGPLTQHTGGVLCFSFL